MIGGESENGGGESTLASRPPRIYHNGSQHVDARDVPAICTKAVCSTKSKSLSLWFAFSLSFWRFQREELTRSRVTASKLNENAASGAGMRYEANKWGRGDILPADGSMSIRPSVASNILTVLCSVYQRSACCTDRSACCKMLKLAYRNCKRPNYFPYSKQGPRLAALDL